MIPIKLQIKNFLSYGPTLQTIEFGNYPLICLSGKNGHGKSALLDALTWALWGEARKSGGNAKADQGLLRLGQTQMMVCFDFECNGTFYRVRREYMQTYGKPVSQLEFGLLQDRDRFVPLTEKTIRDTQSKIEQTLHLSFDAFINSAFLRQGQSNEFSKKSPKERKEVLGEILGLDRYETLRKLATEKIKTATNTKLHNTALLAKLEQEISQEQALKESETILNVKKQELLRKEQLHNAAMQAIEKDQLVFQSLKEQQKNREQQHAQWIQEQTRLYEQLRQAVQEWRIIHKKQLEFGDLSRYEKEKSARIQEIDAHQKKFQEQLLYKQELLDAQATKNAYVHSYNEKKATLLTEKKVSLERLLSEKLYLEKTITATHESSIKKEQEYTLTVSTLEQLEKTILPIDTTYSAQEQQFEKRKAYYQQWVALANMANRELSLMEQKNRMVSTEESPSCPLCEQNLSASRKRFLKQKFEDEKNYLKHRFSRLSNIITRLKSLLIEQHTQLETLRKKAEEQKNLLRKKDEYRVIIEKNIQEKNELHAQSIKNTELLQILSQTIEKEETALTQYMQESEDNLLRDTQYKKINATIRDVEEKIAKNTYRKELHEKAQASLASLEKEIASIKQIQEQTLLQQQRMKDIEKTIKKLKELKVTRRDLEAMLTPPDQLTQQESALKDRKKEIIQAGNNLMHQKELLLQEQGRLENQLHHIDKAKKEQNILQKEISRCNATIEDYQAIANATGKDGVQALLIEDTIPEIEQEANDLLAKLTDNQTHLFIESLRDLKKGGTKETLDIKISDANGIRPYELFSGGEAFRIDFALRIAISKLLARRAGTSLKTLIIDEGFGSQDEDGLSHIMDTLYKIQDDFTKIIIVSHLPSMKNQFPVHFYIEKGPNGSTIEIMEQG